MAYGPNQRALSPDPLLTNVMVDQSNNGGWKAPLLCPVKAVGKDYVRWGKRDAKTLLSNLMDTLRTPGARANLLTRPVTTWLTSIVSEDAVRVEYTEEDVANAVSSISPRLDSALKILNVLQYAQELRVAQLYDPAGFAAANKTAAGGAWATTTSKSLSDIENAKAIVAERSGLEANYIRIPRKKIPGWLASDEISKNVQGVYSELMRGVISGGGVPASILGLTIVVGTARQDTTPTGALTPGFVWDQGNLASTAHVGYSPVLNGGSWSGDAPAFIGQFENQINGTAYAANEYLSPYFQEDGVHIVHGNVRRSLPEVFNAELCFAITSI